MSLLEDLLLLPLAPVRGVVWLSERVAEQGEDSLAERRDPGRVLEELAEARTGGELSDEEYLAAEEALLRELVPEPVQIEPVQPGPRELGPSGAGPAEGAARTEAGADEAGASEVEVNQAGRGGAGTDEASPNEKEGWT